MPCPSALEVRSRQGAIQIHVYLTFTLPYLILRATVVAAAGRTREVPARAGRLHRQFRRRVSGDSSSKPDAVLADARRHSVASVLADVWRTVP